MCSLCPGSNSDSGAGVPLTRGETSMDSMVQRFVHGLSFSLACEFRVRCRIVVLAGKQRTSAWVDAIGLRMPNDWGFPNLTPCRGDAPLQLTSSSL